MPWYYIVLLICLVVGPFDALYMYIKAGRRRDELRRRRDAEATGAPGDRPKAKARDAASDAGRDGREP